MNIKKLNEELKKYLREGFWCSDDLMNLIRVTIDAVIQNHDDKEVYKGTYKIDVFIKKLKRPIIINYYDSGNIDKKYKKPYKITQVEAVTRDGVAETLKFIQDGTTYVFFQLGDNFQNGTIEEKDFNKIIKAIGGKVNKITTEYSVQALKDNDIEYSSEFKSLEKAREFFSKAINNEIWTDENLEIKLTKQTVDDDGNILQDKTLKTGYQK